MPIPSDLGRSYRVRLPSVLSLSEDTVARLESRLGASEVAPASGTYTLMSSAGAVVVTGAVVMSGDTPTFTVSAAALVAADVVQGVGLREVWELVYSAAPLNVTVTVPAAVAKYPLHCPVTQADLEGLYPDLGGMLGASASDVQLWIDGAWTAILRRMLSEGRYPAEVVDTESLVQPVTELALADMFRHFGLTSPRYQDAATEHREAYSVAWAGVTFRIDTDGDGIADSQTRTAGSGIIRRNRAPGLGTSWRWRMPW